MLKPEHGDGDRNAAPAEAHRDEARPWVRYRRRAGLDRRAHRPQTVPRANGGDQPGDRRVQVEMLVRIDMVETQPGRVKCRELRLDLGRELAAGRRQEEHRRSGERHVIAKSTVCVDQAGHLPGGQNWRAIDQRQVQPDAERRQPPRTGNRVGDRRAADHQAGRGQDAVAMRDLDRFVDRDVVAEVVGGDDERLQTASFRRRRKSKNSTPSRRRRFIMSQSRSISQTIAPIFDGRK